jgi:glycerophosphoryl diester phosphodiesterase
VYAHRGGAALRPENTIEAFDHGLSLGADGLEFDVHLSKDGVVVVHHDATLDRTTNGRGPLAAHTAADLARLDAGFWFRPADGTAAAVITHRTGELPPDTFPFRERGARIPALRDVLQRYPHVELIIELKVNDVELARRTIDEIRAAGAVDRVALGSFYWHVLRAARAYEPRMRTGASREETRWALYRSWVGWPLGRPAYREFQVPETSGSTTIVTRRFLAHAHRAHLPVKVWTVNDPDDMQRLLGWGADALISDRPDLAVRTVKGATGARGSTGAEAPDPSR